MDIKRRLLAALGYGFYLLGSGPVPRKLWYAMLNEEDEEKESK